MKNAAMTESLIPPETMNLVGQRLAEPVTVRIDAREAQRYACAVGDLNPVYFDEEAALSAGDRTLALPPTTRSPPPQARTQQPDLGVLSGRLTTRPQETPLRQLLAFPRQRN